VRTTGSPSWRARIIATSGWARRCKDKVRQDLFHGPDQRRELVVENGTGAINHQVEEALSERHGHGGAKLKMPEAAPRPKLAAPMTGRRLSGAACGSVWNAIGL
jgi:hypothetical protein